MICMYVSSLGNLRRILSRGAVAKVILYGSAVEELLPCCFFVQKENLLSVTDLVLSVWLEIGFAIAGNFFTRDLLIEIRLGISKISQKPLSVSPVFLDFYP